MPVGETGEHEATDRQECHAADRDDGDDEVAHAERLLNVGGEEGGRLPFELVEPVQKGEHRDRGGAADGDALTQAHVFLADAREVLVGAHLDDVIGPFGFEPGRLLVEHGRGEVGRRAFGLGHSGSPTCPPDDQD